MKKLLLGLLLLSPLCVKAQTADVVELSNKDAAKAKFLYSELDRINAEIDRFRASVSTSYVEVKGYNPNAWVYGFTFSKNFKFIVPRQIPETSSYPLLGAYPRCNTLTMPVATPAYFNNESHGIVGVQGAVGPQGPQGPDSEQGFMYNSKANTLELHVIK